MSRTKKKTKAKKNKKITTRRSSPKPHRSPAERAEGSLTRRERLKQTQDKLSAMKAREGGEAFSAKTKGWWARVKEKSDQLWAWYSSLPAIKKVLWGLIVIPIVLLIIIINIFLAPLIAPFLPFIGGLLFTAAKLSLVVAKFGAFAVYIGYKVLKSFLGFYYCISRTLSGLSAERQRASLCEAPLRPESAAERGLTLDPALAPLSMERSWKRLKLLAHGAELNILCSYLRYFLIGQLFMYVESFKEWRCFLTLWRPESRETLKDQFALVGTTIFRPYELGPHLSHKRLLIPGDAQLTGLHSLSVEGQPRLRFTLEIPWKSWRFNRRWPFAHSELHRAKWSFELPAELALLDETQRGWLREAVLETGAPAVEDVIREPQAEPTSCPAEEAQG